MIWRRIFYGSWRSRGWKRLGLIVYYQHILEAITHIIFTLEYFITKAKFMIILQLVFNFLRQIGNSKLDIPPHKLNLIKFWGPLIPFYYSNTDQRIMVSLRHVDADKFKKGTLWIWEVKRGHFVSAPKLLVCVCVCVCVVVVVVVVGGGYIFRQISQNNFY